MRRHSFARDAHPESQTTPRYALQRMERRRNFHSTFTETRKTPHESNSVRTPPHRDRFTTRLAARGRPFVSRVGGFHDIASPRLPADGLTWFDNWLRLLPVGLPRHRRRDRACRDSAGTSAALELRGHHRPCALGRAVTRL